MYATKSISIIVLVAFNKIAGEQLFTTKFHHLISKTYKANEKCILMVNKLPGQLYQELHNDYGKTMGLSHLDIDNKYKIGTAMRSINCFALISIVNNDIEWLTLAGILKNITSEQRLLVAIIPNKTNLAAWNVCNHSGFETIFFSNNKAFYEKGKYWGHI